MPTTCVRCGKEVGLLELRSFNRQTGRCSRCSSETLQALQRFRGAFLNFSQSGLTPEKWNKLVQGAAFERLDLREALAYIQADALSLMERILAFATDNRDATADDERYIHYLLRTVGISRAYGQPLLNRLAYLKHIGKIRRGEFQTIHPSIHLETDELCYLETEAVYHKENTRSVSYVSGRIVATNKKLRFLSASGGMEISWKSVMSVEASRGGVYVELSRKSGNGFYGVSSPLFVEAVLDTLARQAKFQLTTPSSSGGSRRIPHDVQVAVWQRDQGRCVRCGAQDYLEFDHIIPFSKGGASSVANVQLLCRRCNQEKSDRI